MSKLKRFLPLSQLAKEVAPRRHASTVHRWAMRGVRGVRLATVLVGGRRCSTVEDLERFIVEVSAARQSELPPQSCPSTSARLETASRPGVSLALQELEERGLT